MKTLIFSLLGMLVPFCAGAQSAAAPAGGNEVVEVQPRTPDRADEARYRSIFLAGTIDMGRSADWQAATVERFRALPGRYLFFNPRRDVWSGDDPAELEYQIAWELEHLERADTIVMCILGSSKSPVTLLEMGIHIRSGKLLVACEPDYYRYDNVRVTCRRYGVPLFASLDELLDKVYGLRASR